MLHFMKTFKLEQIIYIWSRYSSLNLIPLTLIYKMISVDSVCYIVSYTVFAGYMAQCALSKIYVTWAKGVFVIFQRGITLVSYKDFVFGVIVNVRRHQDCLP